MSSALELHELQVQEAMKQSFDEFRGNVFTCLRICIIIHRLLHLILANYDLQNLSISLENRIQFLLREKLLGKTDQWTVTEENVLEPVFIKEQELKEMKKKLLETQKELQVAKEVIHHLERQKERVDKKRLDEEFG